MQLQTTIQTAQRSQQEERSFSTARDQEVSNERKAYPLSNLSFDDADISTLRTVMPLQSAIFYWEFLGPLNFSHIQFYCPWTGTFSFIKSFWTFYDDFLSAMSICYHTSINALIYWGLTKNNFHRSLCLLHLLTEQRLILDTKDLVIVISWRYLLL